MDMHSTTLLWALMGGVALISLVAIIGGFLQCRRERILDHRERMKAIEMGFATPDDAITATTGAGCGVGAGATAGEDGKSLARKCLSTSLWIAFWGFMAASQAGTASQGVAIAIAASVGAIGVAGMICGTILALRAPAPVGAMTRSTRKPYIEADAYDVVSCRG